MINFLLSVMPGMMAKYEYAHDLLNWAEKSIADIKVHKSTIGYPTLEPQLLSSLEKVAQDLGSVSLLRFVISLDKLNAQLKTANASSGDTNLVMDAYFYLEDEIPKLDAELKAKLWKYAWKSILFFLVLLALIVGSSVVLARCQRLV